jgi:N-methylhydantoinase A
MRDMRHEITTILGVDVGGTFTDFLLWEDGAVRAHKRPSTPDDPSRAVLEGIDELGVAPGLVVHGSTVATNAVLTRTGARTALVTTGGMRDLLVIGRQSRPDIYDLEPETPEPLVREELRFELSAALEPDGTVARPLDVAHAATLVEAAHAGGAESVAVSLLYAYVNPELEEQFSSLVEAHGGLYLSASSAVSPEYREVERTGTAVLNAYVGPVMSRYLERLRAGLEERGCGPLRIVQSDGGSADVARASRLPVATLLSGPSAGVAGAFEIARAAGYERVLTFDMGGTSTDVALCDGEIPTRADVVIGGFAARTPVVDVHTVGAGGGSIARLDAGGALRVGPQSAGADPGPASYGRGEAFTVTDAQVVLGRLGGTGLLGGSMALDGARARAAAGEVATSLGSVEAAAGAVIEVATANMEGALRVVSVQRGHDPREFTLVAFGGAGPLHACALAESLEMPRVLIPLLPGVLAAQGAAWSDVTATRSRSVLVGYEPANFVALGEALEAAGAEVLAEPGLEGGSARYAFDMRYAGQSYELSIDVTLDDVGAAGAAFHELHEQRFAHSDVKAAVEVVNVRATAVVRGAGAEAWGEGAAGGLGSSEGGAPGRESVWFGGEEMEAAVYQRSALASGDSFAGPALVHQLDTTTLVAPGWVADVDAAGNLILERAQ